MLEPIEDSIIKMEVEEQANTGTSAKTEPESENFKDEIEEELEPVVEYLDSTPLYRDPTFAEICSFFNTFSHLLGLKQMPYSKLEKLFCRLIDGDGIFEKRKFAKFKI